MPKAKVVSKALEKELGVQAPSDSELVSIAERVNEAATLARRIEAGETLLKQLKEALHLLTTRTLPDAMRAARTEMFKSEDGVKVSLVPFMNGSLPKEEEARKAALIWLEKNGAKDLIKTEFDIALGRGQLKDAKKLRKQLEVLGLDYKEKEGVHAQSLYAFAREKMKAAEELPLHLLGLFAGTSAKIELPEPEEK